MILAQTFVLICAAQPESPATSSGEIQFYVDETSFSHDKDKIYQEFYLMIYADQLKLTPKNNSQYADFSVSISAKETNGVNTYKDSWETEAEVILDSTNVMGVVVYDKWSQIFEPGEYVVEIEVRDNLSSKSGTARKRFEAKINSSENISISNIEFASEISKSQNESIFDKGGLSVIPNPSRRYGILNPLLYFYFEIYNPDISSVKNVTVNFDVIKDDGTSLRSFDEKTIPLSDATSGVPNGFNVSAVASGIYNLRVTVKDQESGEVVTAQRNFEVIQMDFLDKEPLLTNEEAEMFGEIIRLISTEKNYEFYKQLSLASKAKYLIQFWKENDPSPETDVNELFDRIVERYQFANKNFSWGKREGWKSDRGRILIKNGMPDNIQRFPMEESSFPYEIWEYQERRNYIYVFGDLRGDGRYSLIHSNKEDEVNNPYWKEELNRM